MLVHAASIKLQSVDCLYSTDIQYRRTEQAYSVSDSPLRVCTEMESSEAGCDMAMSSFIDPLTAFSKASL